MTSTRILRILHTSDWHVGHTLYRRSRYEEFEAFFSWLEETILQEQVDVLLVAGDVFDSSVPGNRAQELYYRFLHKMAGSSCRHVVIIAGNHDSPSFLNAPKSLLKTLDVHVVGHAADKPEDEVLVLYREPGVPELIVCAAPYLRDREIRIVEVGESVEDKERKLLEGIRNHYAAVSVLAEQKRNEFGGDIPIIAMGHLFAAGGKTVDGDGVRKLYVGSLIHVAAGIFPESFNYLALGHLHAPQKVGDSDTMRYSGSPLPMGFGEAGQQKSVCLVDFDGLKPSVQTIPVPRFQELERVRGDWEGISGRIHELSLKASPAWLEVVYDGDEIIGDLQERLAEAIAGTKMEILCIRDDRVVNRVLEQSHPEETLDDLDEHEVFERCLSLNEVPEDQRPELIRTYQEVLLSLHEDDKHAE